MRRHGVGSWVARTGGAAMAMAAMAASSVVLVEPVVRAPEAQASIVDPGPPPPACKESFYRSQSWPNVLDTRNEADPTRRCYWDKTWTGRGALVELSGAPQELADGGIIDISPRWSAYDPAYPNWTPPTDGFAARASFRLRFNRSPEYPFDDNPFLRSADGRWANPTVGYDDVFVIPPQWDTSECIEPSTTSYRWYTDSCRIKLIKGPYYNTPAGQPVPWMVFTAAYMQNYDSGGFDTPMMTNCAVQCPGPPRWWGQYGYIEMPVFVKPSPYARATSSKVEGRTFAFDGAGSLYNGTIERYDWDFGDGSTASGANVQHTYATEGTYTARLTITADGQSSTTQTTVVAERTVAMDLSISVDNREPAAGDPVKVTYKVRNTGDTSITGVTISHNFSPGAGWTGLTPGSASLAVGATATFTQTIYPDEVPLVISARADGTAGEPVRSNDAALRIGGTNELDVWLDVSSSDVNLDPDGDGNLEPQPVTATVFVSNTGSSGLDDVDVSLQLLSTDTPAPMVVSGSLPNMDIDALAAGQTRSFTVDLSAVEPGTTDVRLDATVLSGNAAGMNDSDLRSIQVTGLADVQFTWKMPERYSKASEAATDSSRGNPKTWEVIVDFKVKGVCPTTGTREWKLNGNVVVPTVIDPAKPCVRKLVRNDLSQFTLSLEAKTAGGNSLGVATQTIQPRDLVIVSLGDSMSSGEGVPQRQGAQWQHEPCHRSSESGMAQAAMRIENDNNPDTTDDDHSSVTFVHLACSGASTWHVNDAYFRGVTGGGMEDPQLFRLRQIIGDRDVDTVLITIGINDIRFGDVLKHCLAYPECDLVNFEGQTLTGFLNARLAALPDSYDRVSQYLRALKIPADRVRLIEYPDPSIGSNLERCGYLSISAGEMEFLRQHLLIPLNQAGEAAAGEHGWQRVGGVADAFARHGLCSPDSWMVGIFQSFAKQGNPDGGFHPNYSGHAQIASIVAPTIRTDGGTGRRVGPTSYPTVNSIAKRGTKIVKVISDVPLPRNTKITIGAGKVSQETRTATVVTAGRVAAPEAEVTALDDTLDPVEEGVAGSPDEIRIEAGAEVAAEAANVYTITLDKPLLYDHGANEMVMTVNVLSPQAREDRLYVSDGPNRFTGARGLYGEVLSSPKAIWYDPPVGVSPAKVQFLVDGKVFTTDATAPYDFIAGQALTVTGFDPSVLSNGAHSVEARALNAAGAVLASESVPITVANPTVRSIRWSTKALRTSASNPLEGARVPAGPAFVSLAPSATTAIKGLGAVEWVLDGVMIDSDPTSPYDLGDGGTATNAAAMPAAARRAGQHTLVVRLKLPSGQTHELARATYRAG